MKSPAFDYIRADSPRHAFDLLAKHGDDARVIAGGQTLLATLNMRLSQPALLSLFRATMTELYDELRHLPLTALRSVARMRGKVRKLLGGKS